jgi:hypothetical protein
MAYRVHPKHAPAFSKLTKQALQVGVLQSTHQRRLVHESRHVHRLPATATATATAGAGAASNRKPCKQMKHTITLLILPAPRRWAKKNTVDAPLGSGHKVAVNLLECHDTAAVLAPENLDIQSTTTTPYV